MAEYYIWSGASGAGDGSSWTDAFTSLPACLTAVTEADGDIFYIASDHIEYESTSLSVYFTASVRLLSVNRVSGRLEAGAIVGTLATSAGDISVDGDVYCHGVKFNAGGLPEGSSAAARSIKLGSAEPSIMKFVKSQFVINYGNASSHVVLGRLTDSSAIVKLDLIDPTFKFSDVDQGLGIGYAKTKLSGGRIDDTGAMPNYVISDAGSVAGSVPDVLFSGCDFSYANALYPASSTKNLDSKLLFVNCLTPATVASGIHPGPGYLEYELHACGTATDDHAFQYSYQGGAGTVSYSSSVYQTSDGAAFADTDGTDTPLSLMMVSSAYAGQECPLYSPWLNVLIDSTSVKTLSVNIAHELGAALKDNDAWIEIEYMGNADNALTSHALSAPVVSGTDSLDVLDAGIDLADTGEAWTGLEDAVTHTLSKAVAVAQQGFVRVRVALAKPSTTLYIDPQVAVSAKLSLDFAGLRRADPRITFTRASEATRVNADGLIETVAADVPRISYDPSSGECLGLLIEEQRTNLLTYSDNFKNSVWGKFQTFIGENAAIAPDGTLTASKLIETAATSEHRLRQVSALTALLPYTESFFVKAGERHRGALQFRTASSGLYSNFNLLEKTINVPGAWGTDFVALSSSIQELSDGWFRVSLTGYANTSVNADIVVAVIADGSNYAGDGASGFYILGMQLEQAYNPSSHIKTGATTVTRAADKAEMTGTNFTSWYNQSEGTFVAEYECPEFGNPTTTFHSAIDVRQSPSDPANTRMLRILTSSNGPMVSRINDASAVSFDPPDAGGAFTARGQFKRSALAYDWAGTSQHAEDGLIAADRNMTGSVPLDANYLYIGSNNNGMSGIMNGHIKSVTYYPTRLSNAELQALTS